MGTPRCACVSCQLLAVCASLTTQDVYYEKDQGKLGRGSRDSREEAMEEGVQVSFVSRTLWQDSAGLQPRMTAMFLQRQELCLC